MSRKPTISVLFDDLHSKILDLDACFDEIKSGDLDYTLAMRVKLNTSLDLLFDLGLISANYYAEHANLLTSFEDRLVS